VQFTKEAPDVVPHDLGLVTQADQDVDEIEYPWAAALRRVETRTSGPAVSRRTGNSGAARCGPGSRGRVRGRSGADDDVLTPDPFAPCRQYLSVW
jgi:hypothetical protein